MAAALVFGVDKFIHNHFGCSLTDDLRTEGDDVGIVVLTGQPCRIGFGADGGSDPLDLIGGKRDADTGTADKNPSFTRTACLLQLRQGRIYPQYLQFLEVYRRESGGRSIAVQHSQYRTEEFIKRTRKPLASAIVK